MGANERAAALEREIFENGAAVGRRCGGLGACGSPQTRVAEHRCGGVARRGGAGASRWVRPELGEGDLRLELRGGRHPVVRGNAAAERRGDDFVPNDTEPRSRRCSQILLLTGPNMSGKSTYLATGGPDRICSRRWGAGFPRTSARIGVVDRIFTRVGASDRSGPRRVHLHGRDARDRRDPPRRLRRRSLVILDEIGRGTSTFDGLGDRLGGGLSTCMTHRGLSARTLFATHYHELTDLARTKPRVRNAHFEAREWKEEVVFLRRLVSGGASRSYGIQVARLAGLPDTLIAARATAS